jgi:hypothetical protein
VIISSKSTNGKAEGGGKKNSEEKNPGNPSSHEIFITLKINMKNSA